LYVHEFGFRKKKGGTHTDRKAERCRNTLIPICWLTIGYVGGCPPILYRGCSHSIEAATQEKFLIGVWEVNFA